MAGRPRTMHRKVNELAAKGLDVLSPLHELAPAQYFDEAKDGPTDPLRDAWRDAVGNMIAG